MTGPVRGFGTLAGATEWHTRLQKLEAEVTQFRVDVDGVSTGHVHLHVVGEWFVTSVLVGVWLAKMDRALTAGEEGVTRVLQSDAEI